jgi:hypothetical protein
MKKILSDLVGKIENSYGGLQFEVVSIYKDNETDIYHIEVKEIPAEEDK